MSAMEKEISPRVNSAMLPNWINKTVRLTCKVIKFNEGEGPRLTVEASDGGQITVHALKEDVVIADPYLEIIGKVVDPTTIQMLGCISMGTELDMKLVNDTITLIHDDRFFGKMFSY